MKKKEKHYLKSLRKNGPSFIIILNILPLPSDILSVILGMVRYDFRKAAIYTIIGRLLKFAFLILLIFICSIILPIDISELNMMTV